VNYLQRKEYFGLSLSLVIIIALLTFINSNYFALTKVTVKGNGLLTNEEIINFTGLNNGQNIFQIDFDKVSNRLMRQPQIKGVVLERRFPSTVRIIVDERTPLVVIQQGGDCLLVSKEGWIVDKRKELTDVSLPLLKGLDVKILGNKIKMTSYIKDSLRYLTGIDEVVNRGITQIQIDNQRNIIFYLGSSKVEFGQPLNINYKVKLFKRIYSKLKKEEKNFDYVNLKYYNNPVIKLE